jgi:hypothetical protein
MSEPARTDRRDRPRNTPTTGPGTGPGTTSDPQQATRVPDDSEGPEKAADPHPSEGPKDRGR